MVRKIFALTSVAAVTGVIVSLAGCSSDNLTPGVAELADAASSTKPTPKKDAGSTTDPSKDGGTDDVDDDDDNTPTKDAGPKKDAGPGPGTDSGPGPGPDTCMVQAPIDATQYPYKTARIAAGACSAAEATTLANYFEGQVNLGNDVSIAAWKGQVSTSCGACVFGTEGEATWGAILTANDALDTVNRGSCMQIQSGSVACGAAYQRVTTCALDACLANCATQQEFDECRADIQGIAAGPCKAAFDTFATDCGANAGNYEASCSIGDWTFDGPIKAQCVVGGPLP